MSTKNKELHFFTAEYPFGKASEAFIENEIVYLSEEFEKITIYPSKVNKEQRRYPKNVLVDDQRTKIIKSKKAKLTILLKYFKTAIIILYSELNDKGFITFFSSLRFFLDYVSIQLLEYNHFNKKNPTDVYYDYWFSNATLMLSIARKKNEITHFIARAHGFDVYDERWGKTGVPFRKFKITNIKNLFLISHFGLNYFKSKIESKHFSKLKCAYLGVKKNNLNIVSDNPVKTILSCSNLNPFKQVSKTIDVLRKSRYNIHWVHIGNGAEMDILKKQLLHLPKNVSVDLKGQLSNQNVLEFYKNNSIDLFLSLSLSEGIPVSMMEAISFGVPIVAYPINGIPELVIPGKTGELFDLKAQNEHQIIDQVLGNSLDRMKVQEFQRKMFHANTNFMNFVKELSSAHE